MTLEDGTKIDMNKYYKIVTNDFMAANGDNYDFTGAKNLKDTNIPIRDVLIKQLQKSPNISPKKVNYLISGKKVQVKPELKPSNKTTIYTVKSGDCLYSIGRKYKVDYRKIAAKNNIANLNLIFIGQKLQIPLS